MCDLRFQQVAMSAWYGCSVRLLMFQDILPKRTVKGGLAVETLYSIENHNIAEIKYGLVNEKYSPCSLVGGDI
jgi:hypothetical protein